MKHKIKKVSAFRACCTRPGCVASLEGPIVEAASQEWLDSFFEDDDCPYFFEGRKWSFKKRVEFLIQEFDKEAKRCKKASNYWKAVRRKNDQTQKPKNE